MRRKLRGNQHSIRMCEFGLLPVSAHLRVLFAACDLECVFRENDKTVQLPQETLIQLKSPQITSKALIAKQTYGKKKKMASLPELQ